MPHLDASALTRDPDGLAILAGVVRAEPGPPTRRVPSWDGPASRAATESLAALLAVEVARAHAAPRVLARRVARLLATVT
jgi:hypothetical protein